MPPITKSMLVASPNIMVVTWVPPPRLKLSFPIANYQPDGFNRLVYVRHDPTLYVCQIRTISVSDQPRRTSIVLESYAWIWIVALDPLLV